MIKGFRTVVISKSSVLEYSLGNIKVRNSNGFVKISLDEIHTLIIENITSSMSLHLMKELTNRNINVIYCDEKHLPLGFLQPFYGNYEASKRVESQIKWSNETKQKIWLKIIREKIINQQKVLDAFEIMKACKTEQLLGNLNYENVQEFEAQMAAFYFKSLMGSKFNRRDKEIALNGAFDYVYAILLSTVARYVCAAGYKTELGLWHRNGENKYNLASDLMEPFRPIVDMYLFEKVFTIENDELPKGLIADVINMKLRINNTEQYLNNAIEIYTQSVFRALGENDENLVIFPDFLGL